MILTDVELIREDLKGVHSITEHLEKSIEQNLEFVAVTDTYNNLEMTYQDIKNLIHQFAGGLQHLGVNKGDFVCLFTENNGYFMSLAQAIIKTGAIDVLRGSNAPIDELDYIISHSEPKGVIVYDAKLLNKLKDTLNAHRPNFVVVMVDNNLNRDGLDMPVYTINEIVEMGRENPFQHVEIRLEDNATMLYTSGTTGNPKGVLLTHSNIISQMEGTEAGFRAVAGENTLQILPCWHAYENLAQFYYYTKGCHLHFTNINNLKNDLLRYHIDTMMSVPRIWEAFRLGIYQKLKQKSKLGYYLFDFAVQNSINYKIHKMYSERRITNKKSNYKLPSNIYHKIARSFLKPLHVIATKTIYKKVKEAAGLDKIRLSISGGGALSLKDELFYDAIGINLRIGYGLTETSPVLTLRGIQYPNYLGCVGKPYAHTKIRIVDPQTMKKVHLYTKGLVLAKGPQVMNGYYKDEEATKKVFTEDGWFITGDLGWLTRNNNLVLVGRQKETIVLSSGENVEPIPIEEAILESPYIDQIVLVGQDEASVGALIVPSKIALDKCGILAKDLKSGKTLSIKNPDLRELIKKEIATNIKNKIGLKPFEKVKEFEILKDGFSMDNGLLSQTAKVKRNVIFEKYQDIISKMFNKNK
ncbi:MAG: AMP-dependent synthetase/ligase [Candidatus Gastranaerophilaceae bacterium]